MLTVRECQERGSSVSQPPHVLCVPEVTSLQVCAFPYHTSPDSHPQPVPQQPSHLSPLATGSANPKPRPGRCQSGVGFSDPISVSWTALPGSEQGFSSSFGTSTAQLSSGNLPCTQRREMPGRAGAAPDSFMSRHCRAPRATSPVCPSIPPQGLAQLQGTGLVSSQSMLGTESKQSLNRWLQESRHSLCHGAF